MQVPNPQGPGFPQTDSSIHQHSHYQQNQPQQTLQADGLDSASSYYEANPMNFQELRMVPEEKPEKKTVHGALKVNYIAYFFLTFVFIAPAYTYYMAVSKKEELPFPHTTITDTACHFPQDIYFRLIMATSGSFLSFIFLVIFAWVKYQQQRVGYPGSIYSKLSLLSQASVWGLMAAMGTIDGAWYPAIHTIGAVFFFVVLFVVVVNQTYVLREMHKWDPTVLSKQSYFAKTILATYVAAIWIYCAYGLGFGFGVDDEENRFIVILQWNSVYVCLAWVLSFKNDWSDIYVTLSEPNTKHQNYSIQ